MKNYEYFNKFNCIKICRKFYFNLRMSGLDQVVSRRKLFFGAGIMFPVRLKLNFWVKEEFKFIFVFGLHPNFGSGIEIQKYRLDCKERIQNNNKDISAQNKQGVNC